MPLHIAAKHMASTCCSQMRLLIACPDRGYGSVHMDKLVPSLLRMGINVCVVGWDRKRELPRKFVRDGASYEMIFRGWGYASRLLMLGIPIWIARLAWRLLGENADLVMAIDFDTGLSAALAGCFRRMPFIYNIRDNFAMRASVPPLLAPLVEALDRFVIRRARCVIVPDESRTAGSRADREKFVILRNCALEVTPPPVPETTGTRPFTLYAMGYLRASRGVGVLVELAKRMPDIRILLAGVADEADLIHQATELHNVEYRGVLPVRQALELCFQCDVVVTFYEPNCEINRRAISNKWSDAMMASKPILLNREVLKSRWVEENDIGYLCCYGDLDELEALVRHIREHPAEAARKGANGRRMFEKSYNWAAVEAQLRQLIARLCPAFVEPHGSGAGQLEAGL